MSRQLHDLLRELKVEDGKIAELQSTVRIEREKTVRHKCKQFIKINRILILF